MMYRLIGERVEQRARTELVFAGLRGEWQGYSRDSFMDEIRPLGEAVITGIVGPRLDVSSPCATTRAKPRVGIQDRYVGALLARPSNVVTQSTAQ